MRVTLKDLIVERSPIVSDGSMATALYEKGFYINRSFEELNLTEAQTVREVHKEFKNAGAQILGTNTFAATVPKFTEYGIQDLLNQTLDAAVEIAKEVCAGDCYVVGTMGPLGVILEPLGPTSKEDAVKFYGVNVKQFVESGVDGFSLVGFHDLNELRAAITACKTYSDLPIMAHMAFQENLKTSYGVGLSEFVEEMNNQKVDAIGISGEVGPSGTLTAIERLVKLTDLPISVKPNAGLPRFVNDQYIYLSNPDYFGKFAKRFVQAGATFIGGHSGVYHTHIKAIKNAVQMTKTISSEKRPNFSAVIQPVNDEPKKPSALGDRCRLGHKLANNEKVVSVEIIPPRGVDFEKFLDHCQTLQDAGIEFVNIPDGARAMARMGSLQLSTYVKNHFDLEPIPHLTTRDRNLLGLQGDLLGSYVNGVRNLLLVTGDPPKLGNCPGASAVYDVDAIGLTHIVSRMNQGLDIGGSSFGKPTDFVFGVALNPTARNQELEISRFKYKVEAGAEFAITQPIYCIDSYRKFMDLVGDCSIPIIMGIWPLVSLRNAEFLKNEVPGVEVPDDVIAKMEKAGDDKEAAVKIGLEIAIETVEKIKSEMAGFQISAPFNRVDVAIEVIKSALG